MQRIGGAHELDRRAHGDRALLGALDHRRADHVLAVAPRHDIEGMRGCSSRTRAREPQSRACARGSSRRARRAIPAVRSARQNRGSRRRSRVSGTERARRPRRSANRRRVAAAPRASARIAARGSRWPSPAKKRPLRNRPARSGSSAAMRASSTRSMTAGALGEALDLADVARRARRPACRCAHDAGGTGAPPVDRALARARRPLRGALSPSQNGASMPPASQEALAPRSSDALDERNLRAALGR